MDNFLNHFRLFSEKENYTTVKTNIEGAIAFKGTNLWILIFAIFLASLGLNVNSTAVVIGAMLISPLMGPIIGMGFGAGINDIGLIKKSWYNYFFSSMVGLLTSTLYFLVTPLNEAQSEILSRTYPTIYDVLIAFFGGLAGILANSSKQKGNVIPGVAIATALMPPICTAGYGLATANFQYLFGAIYLYFINTVFIGIATYLTVRYLQFPYAEWPDEAEAKKSRRMILLIFLIAIIPSIFLSFNLFKQNRFRLDAQKFVNAETHFHNTYLLNQEIDSKNRVIKLIFGGDSISSGEIRLMREKLSYYQLDTNSLIVKQGFANTSSDGSNLQLSNKNVPDADLVNAMNLKQLENEKLKAIITEMEKSNDLKREVCKELTILYPGLTECIIEDAFDQQDTAKVSMKVVIVNRLPQLRNKKEEDKLIQWLTERLDLSNIKLVIH